MFQAINILHQGLPKLITRDHNHGILPPKLRPQAINSVFDGKKLPAWR